MYSCILLCNRAVTVPGFRAILVFIRAYFRHKRNKHGVMAVDEGELEKLAAEQNKKIKQGRRRWILAINKLKQTRRDAGHTNVSSDDEVPDVTPDQTPSKHPKP